MSGKVYAVDIDETICEYKGERKYENATPIAEHVDFINKLYDAGNTINYWTSRGMTTGINHLVLTTKQLKEWGCKYHKLALTKPHYDFLIDDKAMRIEELL